MVEELQYQRIKVELLETQEAFFRQQQELCAHKVDRIGDVLRKERMILAGMERGNGAASAMSEVQAVDASARAEVSELQ